METIDFVKLRQQLDEAVTYADFVAARCLADEGLMNAQYQENLNEIMYFRAQREIIDENYKEAIKYLGLAIKYNPSDGASYNDRALCVFESTGNEDQALADFDKGIAVEPDYATIHHNKGWLLNKLGRQEEAILCFNKTLELEPGRAVTYENLADVYLNLGVKQEAIKAFQNALKYLNRNYTEIKEQIEDKLNVLLSE